ncbi:MAG: NERD domain-containing protein [Candidatus Spyradenecus sp.]
MTMNFQGYAPLFWLIGVLFFLITLLNLFRPILYPWIRGKIGEAFVAKRLRALPEEIYKVLHNIILPTVDGITTQIDHIVVSRFGIFVIETKNYGGWIFGDEKQAQWTQCCGRGRNAKKSRFQNPLRQNWRHICTLADLLQVPQEAFHSVIAFCGSGELKTEMPANVLYSARLARYIRSFEQPILNDEDVETLYLAISAWDASVDKKRRFAHVSNLRAAHDSKKLAQACESGELKCPKCGAPMVLRQPKSGGAPFYGCSTFPKCRCRRKAN